MDCGKIIIVNRDKCNGCNACIAVCPVKNCIDGSERVIRIVDERCVACGRCVAVCKRRALSIVCDTERFLEDVASLPMVAIFDPAVPSVFPDLGRLISYLKSIGVKAVFDASFGAELTARSYIEYGVKNNPDVMLTSICPSVVEYCQIYRPQLLPYLAPFHSAILHTAIMIREFFPEYADCKIAAFTPCAAKKLEFCEEGIVEYNVILSKLFNYLQKNNIDLSSFDEAEFSPPFAERGVAVSTPGGLNDLIARDLPELESMRNIRGHGVYPYLDELFNSIRDGFAPAFVDCADCSNTCSFGPGSNNFTNAIDRVEKPIIERKIKHIKLYQNTIKSSIDNYWKEGLYDRKFHDKSALLNEIKIPSKDELKEIFVLMKKSSDNDVLNCGACGYVTCSAMATAVFNNLNVVQNCQHYLRITTIEEERLLEEESQRAMNLALQAEVASEAKTNFLATMSHEIRTPLNAIIGLAEIELQKDDTGARENLEKIHNSGSSLLGIINDILDISKIETGKLELIPVNYDVATLINDAIRTNIIRKGEKPIQFVLSLAHNIPEKLFGDELRIKQVFNNLLSNAFKYTRSGTVELSVDFENSADGSVGANNGLLKISVRDTGIGIKEEDLEKLFSEYSQLDTKANRKIEGTGLGLAITKHLIEMMDGSINVESVYGQGSKFYACIAQGKVSPEFIGDDVIESLRSFRFMSNKSRMGKNLRRVQMPYAHVLVVDDVQTNLDVARGLLLPYGLKVDTVSTGMEAVFRIISGSPAYDAVFLDYMMPVMDGVQTAKRIRTEINNDYAKNIPIIALTADALVGNEEKFIAKGFDAFISKPIDTVRLDEILNQYVRKPELDPVDVCESEIESIEYEIPDIDGVDYVSALSRFGSEAVYLDIIKSFVKNTPSILDRVKNITKESLAEYAIDVHGIKGASRAIGAVDLGFKAEELEHAAKKNLFGFCIAGNIRFLQIAQKLIDDLSVFLETRKTVEVDKPKKDKPDKNLLDSLKTAVENYDMNEIDAVMAELEKYSYEDNILEEIKNYLEMSDFSEIIELLEK